MNLVRIVRFLISWVIAVILLTLILPHIGVNESHFMPPAKVYSNATGKAIGIVTFKKSVSNPNPFRTLERINTLDFKFQAPPPVTASAAAATPATPVTPPADATTDKAKSKKGKKAKTLDPVADKVPDKPTSLVTYQSTAQVDAMMYDTTEKGMSVNVRYEKTLPEINGIDDPRAGQANVGPNSMLSWDWMKWVLLSLVLATGIMLIIDRIGRPQDLH